MTDFIYPYEETDLASIGPAINTLKETFLSRITQHISWRIQQITKFRDAFTEPHQLETFCYALYQDLGKSRYESMLTEINQVILELDSAIEYLEKHNNLRE